MFAGCNPGKDFDGDATLEEVVEDNEAFEEIASKRTGRSLVASLPLAFSSRTFQQIGSSASRCRAVFCLSVLTRTKPTRIAMCFHSFVHQTLFSTMMNTTS